MFIKTLCHCIAGKHSQKSLLLCKIYLSDCTILMRKDFPKYLSTATSSKSPHFTSSVTENLAEIFKYRDTNISNWIIETKVAALCRKYRNLSVEKKHNFLWTLAFDYAVNHSHICSLSKKLAISELDETKRLATENVLKKALDPKYQWLFILMGRIEHGVKFLVDLRTDILTLLSGPIDVEKIGPLQQLNLTLHNLLLLWFSVGFLHLERITWQSSCEMLQKISDYEAIHPVKNWLDLKRRVGYYRRCFVFTHPSMPGEPLVVLHTALCDTIPETVKGIDEAEQRMSKKLSPMENNTENIDEIKAAIFYSIAATQKGLQGIELGNYLIKEVAKQVTHEFPMIDQLSSLSPIPKFRLWLLDRLRQDEIKIFSNDELFVISDYLNTTNLYQSLRKLLNNSLWINDDSLTRILREPLIRACAWYLYREKRRNYALNTVANFHLRNGAVMWRINWMADVSPRGSDNSCGIMVNYRYYLKDTEKNSRNYIENNVINASESVINLVRDAEKFQELSTNNK